MTNSNKDKSKKTTKKQIDAVYEIDETRNLDILGSKKEAAEVVVEEEKKPVKKTTAAKKTTKKTAPKEVVKEGISEQEIEKEIEKVEEETVEIMTTTPDSTIDPITGNEEVDSVVLEETKENGVLGLSPEEAENDMKKKNQKNQNNKKKSKWSRSNTIIVAGIVLIMIPILLLAWVLLDASSSTGKVILGDRFKGDLDPAITSAQITEIDNSVTNLTGAVDVDVLLKVATLRVYVQVEPSLTAEEYIAMMDSIYKEVTSILPAETYFTLINNTKKQYDLEIHVYSANMDYDSDEFVYYIMNKSSTMAEPNMQLVSEPLNPELAEELRQAVIDRLNPPEEDDGDIIGNSEDGSTNGEGENDENQGAGE